MDQGMHQGGVIDWQKAVAAEGLRDLLSPEVDRGACLFVVRAEQEDEHEGLREAGPDDERGVLIYVAM